MESKRNIIIIHEDGRITGGSSKIAIETAIGLSQRGESVIYFCATALIDDRLKNCVKKIVCLNQKDIASDDSKIRAIKNGVWNKEAYVKLSNLLRECGNNTIVHIHGWSHILSSSIFKACVDNKIAPYVTLHDYFCVCPNGGFYNYQSNCICEFAPMSMDCKKCNCDSRSYKHKIFRILRQAVQDKYVKNNASIKFIYISKFSLSKIQNYLKSDNFAYLHNPVDYYHIDKIDARKNSKYLYIGRISPEKGVDIFCKALSQLKRSGIIIGDGPLKEKLSEDYPSMEFVGWKTKQEIIPYLKQAKCLVFPSKWYEGAPLTTEECLNVGIPCIVSDKCAAIDQIINGIDGFSFRSESVDDLVNKILSLDNDSELFESDRWQLEDYSLSSYIEKLTEIYSR